MTILQKLGRAIGGDSSALDSDGYPKPHSYHCDHCYCDTLNAHNHRPQEQYQRMTELVRRVRV